MPSVQLLCTRATSLSHHCNLSIAGRSDFPAALRIFQPNARTPRWRRWQSRQDQRRPSRPVSRIGCSQPGTTHDPHRIAHLLFCNAVAFPSIATVPQHRPLHRYLVAGDSRGPTCVTSHSWSPPLDRRAVITDPFTSTKSAAAPAGSTFVPVPSPSLLSRTGCRHPARRHVAARTAAGSPAAHDALEIVPGHGAGLVCDSYWLHSGHACSAWIAS